MIRQMKETDLPEVMEIWQRANEEAHAFIPAAYWQENYDMVCELLPQAEVYVYEKNVQLSGFIGMNGEYIAGIFVRQSARSQGVGKQLIHYVKDRKERLILHVYEKNKRAIHFYEREGFVVVSWGMDGDTGETEYVMEWKK
ncbi:MAG: N-acetyltransferase [Clostridiales bacterium]|nr:N-acetyltransferase [Clostridiales bacterium]